ncbi:MAG: hypothetical protein EAZ55_12685 [Cytophagales bacterium]|nr:MAG: hypothetical protein EAZ55_12685 [Cytophagales bacterium]
MKAITLNPLTFNTKLLIVVLYMSIPIFSYGQNYEKRKTINKAYTAEDNTTLNIDNKYGKVNITTNEGKAITVDITIIAKAGSEQKATDILNAINIEIGEGSLINPIPTISFKTVIGTISGSGQKFEINYQVNIPKWLTLNLINKYGDSYVAPLTGNTTLDISYGNLKADNLGGKTNIVKISYSKGTILNFAQGSLVVKYSDFTLGTCGDLNLENSYSDLEIGSVNNLTTVCKYGEMLIQKANSITGESNYTDFNVINLGSALQMTLKYSSGFEIARVSSEFKNIAIDAQYSDCRIGFLPNTSYNFDLDLKYSGASIDTESVSYSKKVESDYSSYYAGKSGKTATPNAQLKIISKYGNVNLEQAF